MPATLLVMAGLRAPDGYQGSSLSGYLGWYGEPSPRKDFFCEHHMNNSDIPKWEGVRTGQFKYANYYEQSPPFELLHDLKADPDELVNLAQDPAYANTLTTLRGRVSAYKSQYPAASWLK